MFHRLTALTIFVALAMKVVSALPDLTVIGGVHKAQTLLLENMATNAENPHIRFDTNRAFYAYARNFGVHQLDVAME